MKKVLLSILLVICAISCVNKPETIVSKFIDNVKEKKIEEAAKYTSNSDFIGNIGLEYNNKVQELLFETLFKNMKYEIVNTEKKDKDTTVVTVNIENVDTHKVFLTIFSKMFQEAFSNNGGATSIEDEFNKILSSNEVPMAKNTTQFTVVKTKKGNKIEITPENIDILFGKLNTTLSSLNNLGEEEQPVNNKKTEDKSNSTESIEGGPSVGKDQKLVEPTKKN